MTSLETFIGQGPYLLVRRADAVLLASTEECSLFHGLRVLLEPTLNDLSALHNGEHKTLPLSGQKDAVERSQARLESVLDIFDFIEVHETQAVFLAVLDLLRLAKVVIDAQVEELYARPLDVEPAPTPSALAPVKSRRVEVAA